MAVHGLYDLHSWSYQKPILQVPWVTIQTNHQLLSRHTFPHSVHSRIKSLSLSCVFYLLVFPYLQDLVQKPTLSIVFSFWPHHGMQDLSTPAHCHQPGIKSTPPAVEAKTLNHSPTREVSAHPFIRSFSTCLSGIDHPFIFIPRALCLGHFSIIYFIPSHMSAWFCLHERKNDILLKETDYSWHLWKHGKEDFIQGDVGTTTLGYGDWTQSEQTVGKWAFIHKNRLGSVDGRLLRGSISGKGEVWLNLPNRASLIAQLVKNPPAMQKMPVQFPGSGRSVGEGIGYPLQYSWASLVAQLVKNLPAMLETWVWPLGWEDPLEKGKATHSSILA